MAGPKNALTLRFRRSRAPWRTLAADLGTREGVDLLTNTLPHIDILVNNLGIFEPKPFTEIQDDEWLRFFEVNVLSGVRLSRFYLPQMLAKDWGRIVFIQRIRR
jgi:NAD(P)-dependent dehydrogenase (short-subunit alcohol dehydrogenase family)